LQKRTTTRTFSSGSGSAENVRQRTAGELPAVFAR
jgi:hypothetical protein